MHIQAVTMSVSNLENSRWFYEEVLGFEPAYATTEPHRWQAYRSDEEAFFALIEVTNLRRIPDMDIVNFAVEDVEQLWRRAEGRADVEQGLHLTPYGAYKFIIRDPDGLRLGFVTEDWEAKQSGEPGDRET